MGTVRAVAGRIKRKIFPAPTDAQKAETSPEAPSGTKNAASSPAVAGSASDAPAPAVPTSPDDYEKFRMNTRAEEQAEVSRLVPYVLHSALPHASNGYAIRSQGIAKELRKLGWDVEGFTQPGFGRPAGETYDPDPETGQLPDIHLGEEFESVPYWHLNNPAAGPGRDKINAYVADHVERLRTALEGRKPLTIHAASNYLNGFAGVTLANELGIASIYEVRGLWEVTRRGNEPTFYFHPNYHHIAQLETQAASAATYCIAISEQLKEELVFRGVDADKIFVAPNGTDPEWHQPQLPDVTLRAELGLEGKFVVGYVGSVVTYEGLELLLEAAQMLRTTTPNLHVLIVGDGSNLERLRRLVGFLGIEDRVTFTGRVPHEDVGRYSSLIDLVALPRTPLMVCDLVPPLKPFEAMAQRRPVLVSDVAAMAEFITDGENGFVFRRGDARSLAHKIAALAADSQLLERVADQAQQWVADNRTWAHSAAVISEVYERIWAESTAALQSKPAE